MLSTSTFMMDGYVNLINCSSKQCCCSIMEGMPWDFHTSFDFNQSPFLWRLNSPLWFFIDAHEDSRRAKATYTKVWCWEEGFDEEEFFWFLDIDLGSTSTTSTFESICHHRFTSRSIIGRDQDRRITWTKLLQTEGHHFVDHLKSFHNASHNGSYFRTVC